jgi:hypothetical protein
MKTALLLALALMSASPAGARSRADPSLDYRGNLSTGQVRRTEMHHFYCVVQMELAQREIMRGRWVGNPRCW